MPERFNMARPGLQARHRRQMTWRHAIMEVQECCSFPCMHILLRCKIQMARHSIVFCETMQPNVAEG
jgi:hypothetical protein